MGERTLTVSRGALTFTWHITALTIQMYEWDEGAEQPQRHLGFVTLTGEDGDVVPFEQKAFEKHIDWFLDNAAKAGLARARSLLGNALAAELSAVKCGEIGAFDRQQRIEIREFIDGEG